MAIEPLGTLIGGAKERRREASQAIEFARVLTVHLARDVAADLKPEVRAALSGLEARHAAGELKPCQPEGRRHRCFLIAPDGVGSSCVVLSKRRPDGAVSFLNFVRNDVLGIKDAFGVIVPEREFDIMLGKLERGDGMLLAEVSEETALAVCRAAERATFAAGRAFPAEYLAWKWDAGFAGPAAADKIQGRESEFSVLEPAAPRAVAPPFRDLFRLFDCKCMRHWGVEVENAGDVAADWADTLFEKQDPNALPLGSILEKGVPMKDLALWAGRLRQYALVRWMRGEEKPARLALWSSVSLTAENRLRHPFMQALALASVGIYPKSSDEKADETEAHPGVGRNDPCPCGSGRKYKK